jgi:site-specific DNA-methyltransferase (adenine-specific)
VQISAIASPFTFLSKGVDTPQLVFATPRLRQVAFGINKMPATKFKHKGPTLVSSQIKEQRKNLPINNVVCGNCVEIMHQLPAASIDLILTDPPYLVNYRDRSGRSIQNDINPNWLVPALAASYRVLRPNSFMVMFYSWTKVDLFMAAWRNAGFRAVGHLVFRKTYASSSRFLRYQHEQAYLLAKGQPALPEHPIPDVIDMPYSGNRYHPTQKPIEALLPLIKTFSQPGSLILDPFCGSGSTLVAAKQLDRRYLGIDLESNHCITARRRLNVSADQSFITSATHAA